MHVRSIFLLFPYALTIFACLTFSRLTKAATACGDLFPKRTTYQDQPAPILMTPGQWLHRLNPKLHTSKQVEAITRTAQISNGRASNKPGEKIDIWLKHLEKTQENFKNIPQSFYHLKKFFLKRYLTPKETIPESFVNFLTKSARNRGEPPPTLADVKNAANVALTDQKVSLEKWLDFLFSESADYPVWIKFWSFTQIVKLGEFNPAMDTFPERSRDHMGGFPELNRNAYAEVVDIMTKQNDKGLTDRSDQANESNNANLNFRKLYLRAYKSALSRKLPYKSVEGKWRVFRRGSDPIALTETLKDMATGWCTEKIAKAESQLRDGDMHIFYSEDPQKKFTLPRVAIRFEGSKIAEVRGTAFEQNLDPDIAGTNVVSDKLKEFGSAGHSFLKTTSDIRMVTELEWLTQQNIDFSVDQLRFIYQLDQPIKSFGYEQDPRIKKILESRKNVRRDLSQIFKLEAHEVSFAHEDPFAKGIKLHYGDLNVSAGDYLDRRKNVPEIVIGNFYYLDESVVGFRPPRFVSGNIDLTPVTSFSKNPATFQKKLKGSFIVSSLTDTKGLILPEYVGGSLDLARLVDGRGFVLSKHIENQLDVHDLAKAQGLTPSEYVGGDIETFKLNDPESALKPTQFFGGSFFKTY